MKKNNSKIDQIPIVVDLDYTLVTTDTLHELLIELLKVNFFYLFVFPFWLLKGKAYFKFKILSIVDVYGYRFTFNTKLLDWLRYQKLNKKKIVLCTGANHKIAKEISRQLGFFDQYFGSETINLTGKNKENFLVKKFGKGKYDYIGDSSDDLFVWKSARKKYLVSSSKYFIRSFKSKFFPNKIFPAINKINLFNICNLLRVRQYIKNILIFIPLFLNPYDYGNKTILADFLLGFISFSFASSSIYIVNDLFDLQADRLHHKKRFRPFASGAILIRDGLLIFLIALVISLIFGYIVNTNFLFTIISYILISVAYTFYLKKLFIFDCVALAILYNFRLLSGIFIGEYNIELNFFIFSFVFFISLAFLKRLIEINNFSHLKNIPGRPYNAMHKKLIYFLGIASSIISVSFFSFSLLVSPGNYNLDLIPLKIILLGIVMSLWLANMWISAIKGTMDYDPVMFAAKDRISLFMAILFIILFYYE